MAFYEGLLWLNGLMAWLASAALAWGAIKGVRQSSRMLRNASWVLLAAALERAYIALGFSLAALGFVQSSSAGSILRPGMWVASVLLIALLIILHPWDSAEPPAPALPPTDGDDSSPGSGGGGESGEPLRGEPV